MAESIFFPIFAAKQLKHTTMRVLIVNTSERIGGAAYDEAEFWRMMYEMIR